MRTGALGWAIALLLTGCAAPPPPTGETAAVAAPTHRLAPGDRIEVTIEGQPDLSGVYDLDLDGALDLPLVGRLDVYGRTTDEVAADVVSAYAAGYLRVPVARVEFVSARPFFISGAVERPGSYPFAPGMTVADAVARAGGPLAAASEVRLIREGRMARVSDDVLLAPGDVLELGARAG